MFGELQILPEEQDAIDDIETPPGQAPPLEDQTRPIDIEPKRKYGPKAPRYGPLVPADEEVIAGNYRGRSRAEMGVGR
jgi:hypothetical protein